MLPAISFINVIQTHNFDKRMSVLLLAQVTVKSHDSTHKTGWVLVLILPQTQNCANFVPELSRKHGIDGGFCERQVVSPFLKVFGPLSGLTLKAKRWVTAQCPVGDLTFVYFLG